MSEIPGQSGHALPNLQRPFCATCGLMHRSTALSFDHLVGNGQQSRWEFQPEQFRRRTIKEQFEFGLLIKGNVRRFCASQYLVAHSSKTSLSISNVSAIG